MKREAGGTKGALVRELWALPDSPARNQLVQRALKGMYHDFESPHALPKMMLVDELMAAGFDALAAKAKGGAFDDEPPPRRIPK